MYINLFIMILKIIGKMLENYTDDVYDLYLLSELKADIRELLKKSDLK